MSTRTPSIYASVRSTTAGLASASTEFASALSTVGKYARAEMSANLVQANISNVSETEDSRIEELISLYAKLESIPEGSPLRKHIQRAIDLIESVPGFEPVL